MTLEVYLGMTLVLSYQVLENMLLIPLKAKVKADIALPGEIPPQSYGTSLAVWDHTVLPATRHKQTHST